MLFSSVGVTSGEMSSIRATVKDLDDHLLAQIFRLVPAAQRAELAFVCTSWRRVLQSPEVWPDFTSPCPWAAKDQLVALLTHPRCSAVKWLSLGPNWALDDDQLGHVLSSLDMMNLEGLDCRRCSGLQWSTDLPLLCLLRSNVRYFHVSYAPIKSVTPQSQTLSLFLWSLVLPLQTLRITGAAPVDLSDGTTFRPLFSNCSFSNLAFGTRGVGTVLRHLLVDVTWWAHPTVPSGFHDRVGRTLRTLWLRRSAPYRPTDHELASLQLRAHQYLRPSSSLVNLSLPFPLSPPTLPLLFSQQLLTRLSLALDSPLSDRFASSLLALPLVHLELYSLASSPHPPFSNTPHFLPSLLQSPRLLLFAAASLSLPLAPSSYSCPSSLTSLTLSRCHLDAPACLFTSVLPLCPRLASLAVDQTSPPVPSRLLSLLQHLCPRLTALRLSHQPDLTDAVLEQIASGHARLTHLDISHCPSLSDLGLHALCRLCPNLVSLSLSSCVLITDVALTCIASCLSRLTHFCLGDASSRPIPALTHFGVISLASPTAVCRLRVLQLLPTRDFSRDTVWCLAQGSPTLRFVVLPPAASVPPNVEQPEPAFSLHLPLSDMSLAPSGGDGWRHQHAHMRVLHEVDDEWDSDLLLPLHFPLPLPCSKEDLGWRST